jgi:tetratricopeptide (TPR) repeat protein
VIARNPAHADALRGLARIEQLREHWELAADWQRKALAASPQPRAEDAATLGYLLYRAGALESAETELQRALEIDPYSYLAHRNLGELYRRQQRWTDARRHLEFVVRYFPERDPSAYAALVDVCRMAGDLRAARAAYLKARRLFPEHPEVLAISPVL